MLDMLVFICRWKSIYSTSHSKPEYITAALGIRKAPREDGIGTGLFHSSKVVLGWRRCSSSPFIKYSVWLAYTCTPVVATYTLGFMNTPFICSGRRGNYLIGLSAEVYLLVWSFSLAFALGSTTYSITAYDVDDNKQYMRHLFRQALYVVNIVSIIRLFPGYNRSIASLFDSPINHFRVELLPYLLLPLSIFSTITNIMATSCSDNGSLYLQDYMKKEQLESTNYDPVTLEGYNYPIFFNASPNEVITVSQVWISNRGLLSISGNNNTRLKEVCLSFALSRLLKRRFFGAACPEATLPKTHDLVFRGLLSNVEENYLSAYRVIETELAFIHDHFFITSPIFGPLIVVIAIVKAVVLLLLVDLQNSVREIILRSPAYPKTSSMHKDRSTITVIIILVLSALEFLQLYIFLTSNFAKVKLACWSINPFKCGIWFQILQVCNKLPQLFGCWQNKIGQHSLLKDLHSRSIKADVMGSLSWTITFCILPSNFKPSAFPRGICNPGIKGPYHTRLTCGVKKAIAHTLKNSDGHLSNGKSSLERNGQVQLSKEFLLGNHANDLLIWHIATEYCDMAQSLQAVRQDDIALSNRDVASRLSSYCAYLMAFVPELLPDHQLETTAMLHRARNEALKHLQGDTSLRAKYTKLRNCGQPSQQNGTTSDGDGQPPPQNGDINHGKPPRQDGDMQDVNIFMKGIQLGKRLEGIPDNGTRWKMLADFWTEMILYIAPSNNARDHIQHLANGGEFITHLWALLTHAGILERPPQKVVNVQNATEAANRPHQDHAQGLQPEPPHTEDTQNPVNLHEIEEETNASGSQEANRGNLPDLGNNDSNASTSINRRPRVGIV